MANFVRPFDIYLKSLLLLTPNLEGDQLRGMDLRGYDLSCFNFTKADLTGARYNDQTIFPDGFDPIAVGMVKGND